MKGLCNNHSAIHLCKNYTYHERTKHIDTKLYWIRDVINEGKIQI